MAGIISCWLKDVPSQFITSRNGTASYPFNFTKTRKTHMSKVKFKPEKEEERNKNEGNKKKSLHL